MAIKNIEFTERLKWVIKNELKLSRNAFADRANIGRSTLGNYFNKKNYGRVPEWDQLLKISIAINKPIEWLLTGKEPQKDCPVNCGKEMQEACVKTKKILESGTDWSRLLNDGINTFFNALEELEINRRRGGGNSNPLERQSGTLKKAVKRTGRKKKAA